VQDAVAGSGGVLFGTAAFIALTVWKSFGFRVSSWKPALLRLFVVQVGPKGQEETLSEGAMLSMGHRHVKRMPRGR
jgi:hypothetical protein